MRGFFITQKNNQIYRRLTSAIAFVLTFSLIFSPVASYAQAINFLNLPIPGTLLAPSPGFTPAIVRGITIHPDNPLMFDFIVDKGDTKLAGEELEEESIKLIKYFLATLTVPEDELWVNLSPYESDRIISGNFGQTEMGRDLLAQDYMLKQLSASLMYPENDLGNEFWNRVYERAQEEFGTTDIPMNTFNKIWIVPETAVVFEHESSAYVVESHLKVMLEEDYVALQKNLESEKYGMEEMMQAEAEVISGVSSEIVREILIPEIEKEVNEGKTFASLRQIYNSMILATWYKKNLKESLLGQVYMDKNKIRGIDVEDKEINQKIYNQYLTAFKKGVYNYIKEDYDPTTQQIIPRKYFSGGAKFDIKKIFKDKDEMTNLTLERFIEFLHALDSEKLSPKSARKLIAKRNTFDAQGREACDAALRNEALEKIRVRLDEFSEDGLEAEEKASSPVLTVKEHLTPFVKAKTESVGIFEAELGMAKALLETAIDKVIEIRIISKNGKESTIHIPDEGNEGLMNDVYLRYVAKIYARSMAIGNGPYDFLYVEAKDKQGNIKSNVEDALKKIVMEYFESEGNPLLSKANGGEQVKVLSADQYTGKKSFRSQGKITAGIFDGGGVGVILTDELGEIDGLNEGGHFSNNIRDDYKRYIESENSPSGSIELEAGSVPSILHVAELIGVNEEMEESFSIENVTPEHIGWAAAGFNPIDHKTLLSKDSKIQKLCLDVWDEIGKREAQAILHMHLLYGGEILDFIIGGGSMRGETGKIREGITREYLRRYEKELKTIYEEIGKKHEIKSGFFTEPIKVDLVQADNAGRGAALKAKELAVQKFGSLSEKDVLVGFDIGGKGFKPYVMDAAGNDITAELLGEENESEVEADTNLRYFKSFPVGREDGLTGLEMGQRLHDFVVKVVKATENKSDKKVKSVFMGIPGAKGKGEYKGNERRFASLGNLDHGFNRSNLRNEVDQVNESLVRIGKSLGDGVAYDARNDMVSWGYLMLSLRNSLLNPEQKDLEKKASSPVLTADLRLSKSDSFVDGDAFRVDNYMNRRPRTGFMHNTADPKKGKPVLAFFSTVGQLIATLSFGDKNNSFLRFRAASRAERDTPQQGFRTHIFVDTPQGEEVWEPFQNNTENIKDGVINSYIETAHDLTLESVNPRLGLKVVVNYFEMVDEGAPIFMREVKVENMRDDESRDVRMVDGVLAVTVAGISKGVEDAIERTGLAFTNVNGVRGQNIKGEEGERLVNGASAYQTTYDLSDKPVFERTIPRHIYAAWNPDNGNILQTIFNQEVVYGKSGATIPFGVLNYDFETPDALDQHVSTTQAPCAMNYTKFVLEPKGSIQSAKRVVSLITHTNGYEEANKIIRRFTSSKDFVDQKKKSGRKFINSIRHKVLTKMSSKYAVFTQYMGNNQLDNVLRGGLSIPIKTKKGIVSVNVLSRIHGDLERDYNWYLVLMMYYSQGIGAYRDMLQNMLNDAWLSKPDIPAEEGTLDMLNLIQADAFNPKVVKPDVFKAESDEDVENALSKMVASNEEKEKLRDMMKNGFTLGELFGYIVENKLQSKQSNVESHEIQVFEDILLHTVKQKQAEHGEGFWTDHWHYNLDSIKEYLRLNPDKWEHLFSGKMFSYYLNNHSVRKRDHDDKGNGRYYYSQFKERVIQPNSVINREDVKAEEKGNLLRTMNGEGEAYFSNLIVKILTIITNKSATLDPFGVGVEMEADKPNWYDALNGLPGMIGSSISETHELQRAAKMLLEAFEKLKLDDDTEIAVFKELSEFIVQLKKILETEKSALNYWKRSNDIKEEYRKNVQKGLDGETKSLSVKELREFLELVIKKTQKSSQIATEAGFEGKTYFYSEVTEYDVVGEAKDGLVPVKPLNFQLKALPIYLEGYVHKMRIARTVEERKAIHSSVMESELVDSATGMLKVTGSLNEQPIDAGRGRLFQKSWFERETVWMHMFLKYVYELINNGMYEEFYELFEHIVPFLDPNKYGNTLFNSSMIVSDAAEDETLQSAGFIARLSGATASMLSIWLRMHLGREPFYVNDNGELVFSPQPALKADMFSEEDSTVEYVTEEGIKEIECPKGSLLFNFRDGTIIRYINPEGKDTFGEDGVKPVKYVLTYADSGKQIEVKEVVGELAENVRSGKFSFIDISLATEKLDQNQKNNSMISEEEKKGLKETLEAIIAGNLSDIKKPIIPGKVTSESLHDVERKLKSKSYIKTEREYIAECFYVLLKYLEQDDFDLEVFEAYKMSFLDSLDAIVLTDGNDNNSVKGGIDLDPAMMDLQIKRDGNGVPLPVFQQPLDMINIKGFVPVIINVTPILNLPLLLGFADSELPVNSTESDSQTTAFDLSLVDKYRNKYTDRYEHQNDDIDA